MRCNTGGGSPGPQSFAVEDPQNYENVLASGWTQPFKTTVPEPASLLLLLASLGGLAVRGVRNRAA